MGLRVTCGRVGDWVGGVVRGGGLMGGRAGGTENFHFSGFLSSPVHMGGRGRAGGRVGGGGGGREFFRST